MQWFTMIRRSLRVLSQKTHIKVQNFAGKPFGLTFHLIDAYYYSLRFIRNYQYIGDH